MTSKNFQNVEFGKQIKLIKWLLNKSEDQSLDTQNDAKSAQYRDMPL